MNEQQNLKTIQAVYAAFGRGDVAFIVGPSRSNLTFLVEGQLFAQEEILSSQGGSGLKEAAQESDEVQTDVVKGQRGMPKGVV